MKKKNAFCDSFLAINFNCVTMFHVFGSLALCHLGSECKVNGALTTSQFSEETVQHTVMSIFKRCVPLSIKILRT